MSEPMVSEDELRSGQRTGAAARTSTAYSLDLRIDATSEQGGRTVEHTLWAGPGHSRAEYLKLAATIYSPGHVFHRTGTNFRVRRCYLVDTTTTTVEVTG